MLKSLLAAGGASAPVKKFPNTLAQTIHSPDGNSISQFGASQSDTGVAISHDGNWLAIANPGATVSGISAAGLVYIYQNVSGTYTYLTSVQSSSPTANYNFGAGLCLDSTGTRLVVFEPGSSLASIASKIYVFTRSGTTWTLETTMSRALQNGSAGTWCSVAWCNDDCSSLTYHSSETSGAVAYTWTRSGTSWSESGNVIQVAGSNYTPTPAGGAYANGISTGYINPVQDTTATTNSEFIYSQVVSGALSQKVTLSNPLTNAVSSIARLSQEASTVNCISLAIGLAAGVGANLYSQRWNTSTNASQNLTITQTLNNGYTYGMSLRNNVAAILDNQGNLNVYTLATGGTSWINALSTTITYTYHIAPSIALTSDGLTMAMVSPIGGTSPGNSVLIYKSV